MDSVRSDPTLTSVHRSPLLASAFVVLERRTPSSSHSSPLGGRAPRTCSYGECIGHLVLVCGPARSSTNVAVKISPDSKAAAKPSSDFTLRHCQALQNKRNRVP